VRVLYFSRDYTPHDHRFLTSLVESAQEVYFLRLERRGLQMEDRSLPPEVNQVHWRGGKAPFRWRDLPALLVSLHGVLRQVKPDIIQAGPIQTAAFLAALSGFRPLVVTSWGSDILRDAEKNRWYRWITRYTLSRSTTFAGDCAAVREKALSFGVPAERIFIFPWGINLDDFSPGPADGWRARLDWQNNFVILSLRSWEPVYGVDVMLRGFALAAQQAPELRLLLLGGGSLAGQVHQIIQQYNLQDRVHLGGLVNQKDLPNIYRSADLYVSASHSDGSSVSLMEALGSGLPVVLSDIPSNCEWITDGVQGWLFQDGCDQSLADAILRALGSPEALPGMRASARARAEERANWQHNFQILLRAFQTALRNNK
jgi:L-malate glycosyltransferase